MKIGLVSAFDYSFHGGVTDHIRNLASQLEAAGHDVVVFGPCSDTTRVPDNFVPMGRPVPIPSNGSIARVSVSVWLSPRIKQLLNREAFDIIHLHEPFSGFVPLNTLSVSETVNVATFHSYRSSHFFRIGGTALTNPYFRRIHGLIAVSKPARDFISQHFPGDYRTIPNGIQLEQFAGGAGPFPHLRDGMINLLFLGRLEKRKGLKYLLSAFSRLKWDWPNLRLIVVGPGKPDDDSYRIMSERPAGRGVRGRHFRRRRRSGTSGARTSTVRRRRGARASGLCCWRRWPLDAPSLRPLSRAIRAS